jgi:hypothetical protein
VARWVEIASLANVDQNDFQTHVHNVFEDGSDPATSNVSAAVVSPSRIFGSASSPKGDAK